MVSRLGGLLLPRIRTELWSFTSSYANPYDRPPIEMVWKKC
jgi:hypothetical protein